MRLTGLLLAEYFKRYAAREVYRGRINRQWHPLRGWKIKKENKFVFNEHRPWEEGFRLDNMPGQKHKFIPVEPIKEWSIFKGDRVEILVGKDKGKQGIVNSIIKERNWVYVDGLNLDYETTQMFPDTLPMCRTKQRPLLVTSQIKLVDPQDNRPTDFEWRFSEEGERVRVSTTTGRVIPLPSGAEETDDMIVPSQYVEGDKDTTLKQIKNVTFEPKIVSFEQDIMDSMGIKETRKRAKTYWY